MYGIIRNFAELQGEFADEFHEFFLDIPIYNARKSENIFCLFTYGKSVKKIAFYWKPTTAVHTFVLSFVCYRFHLEPILSQRSKLKIVF